MAEILLSHGYFMCFDAAEQKQMRPYPPLGLLYLSAWLKRQGKSVEVFDSTFSTPAELIRSMEERRPRVLGLYCNLLTRPRIVELIGQAKARSIPVVVGGPDASGNADEYLKHGAVAVVRGEGEVTLTELLERWTEIEPPAGVPGTSVMRDGEIHHAPDRVLLPSLANHPWPDREAIAIEPYLSAWRARHGYGSVSIITARGCPYTCKWCSRAVYGESHRRRPVQDVVEEIAHIKATYAPERLWFVDDVFTIHKGWTMEFANLIESRGLATPFECISRAERIDDDVADALVRLKCFRVWIGSESGSQRILDAMDRRVRVETVQRATRLLRSRGIAVGFFIMVGYLGEEIEDLEATVRHIRESRPDVVLTTTAYPIHGTDYARDLNGSTVNPKSWELGSDRETVVRGRRTSRFYDAARRWIENDAEASRLRSDGKRLASVQPAIRAGLARLKMRLHEGERVV